MSERYLRFEYTHGPLLVSKRVSKAYGRALAAMPRFFSVQQLALFLYQAPAAKALAFTSLRLEGRFKWDGTTLAELFALIGVMFNCSSVASAPAPIRTLPTLIVNTVEDLRIALQYVP